MPVNDLHSFQVASGPVQTNGTGKTSQSVQTWAAAVGWLWLTPRPRVIIADGLDRFEVVGGEGLTLQAAPATERRSETYRFEQAPPPPLEPAFKDDKDVPPLPPRLTWGLADAFLSPTPTVFDCFFLNKLRRYRQGRATDPILCGRRSHRASRTTASVAPCSLIRGPSAPGRRSASWGTTR